MNRLKSTLMLLLAGVPLLSHKSATAIPNGATQKDSAEPLDPVALRPLNEAQDNLFAGHRSHSSHRSHGSHRSSSGGGYVAPRTPAPQQAPASGSGLAPGSQPTDPGRAAPVSPRPQASKPPPLTTAEKLKLQIMRVQIALTSHGLYSGPVDGVLNQQTQEALKRFQTVKSIPATGKMNTDTLNALGVPAVQ